MSNNFEKIKQNNEIFIGVLKNLITEQTSIKDFDTLPSHLKTKKIEASVKRKPYNDYIKTVLYYTEPSDSKETFIFVDKNFFSWKFKLNEKKYDLEEVYINETKDIDINASVSYSKTQNTITVKNTNIGNFDNINKDFLDLIKLKFDIDLDVSEFDLNNIGPSKEDQKELLKKHESNTKMKNGFKFLKKMLMNR